MRAPDAERTRRRALLAVVGAIALGLSLASCTAGPAPDSKPTSTGSPSTGSAGSGTASSGPTGSGTASRGPTGSGMATGTAAAPTPSTPSDPALLPDLPAAKNLAYFDFVNRKVLAANPKADGRAFIDALVAAGFTKSDMQVTVDTTTANLAANSIQFSVKFNGACLLGQNGPDSGGYHSQVTPVLATGACLVGQTRPIDW